MLLSSVEHRMSMNMRALLATPEYQSLVRELEELAASLEREVLDAKDWPDFMERRGVVDGLRLAIAMPRDLAEQNAMEEVA